MSRRKEWESPLAESAVASARAGYGIVTLSVAFCLSAVTTICFLHDSARAGTQPSATAQKAIASPAQAVPVRADFKQPTTLAELLAIPTADLGKVDLVTMNLLCAEGLPGSEKINIPECLVTLDQWAAKIKLYTERHHDEFIHDATETHSWAEYEMMVIMSALKISYGVHYDVAGAVAEYGFDPATTKVPKGDYYPTDKLAPTFFAGSDLFFVNGLLGSKRVGTCSSLPVLVAAIGQRLGYPVALDTCFRHMFVRWDDGKERFNIETTVIGGLQEVSDEEYHHWPQPLADQAIAAEGYLQIQTPAQNLANFLYSRIACLMACGRMDEASRLRQKCLELVPTSIRYKSLPSLTS